MLESTSSRDFHEEECRRALHLFEALTARDRAALEHLRTEAADQRAIEALNIFFATDRTERQELSKKETVLNIASEVRTDLHSLLRGNLEDAATEAMRHIKRQKELRADAEQAQIEQENIPDADTIAQIVTERDALKEEIEEMESIYLAIGQDIEHHRRELERRERQLARLLEEEERAKGAQEDRARILQHSGRVRATLDAFRLAVIERYVQRIEHLVLQSYKQLLRKSALITRLSIDPTTLTLTLFGRDGKLLSSEQLSAGERQLLAIALLWGLAKASGRPLPTAIDTPLGRLDSSHRMHLVERYLPFASHQVLLLSTDEEISGEYFKRLSPWIGRTYQLDYDDEAGKTQIKDGYFETRVAA